MEVASMGCRERMKRRGGVITIFVVSKAFYNRRCVPTSERWVHVLPLRADGEDAAGFISCRPHCLVINQPVFFRFR